MESNEIGKSDSLASAYNRLLKEKELWEGRSGNWKKLAGRYERAIKSLEEKNREQRSTIDDLRKRLAAVVVADALGKGDDDGE